MRAPAPAPLAITAALLAALFACPAYAPAADNAAAPAESSAQAETLASALSADGTEAEAADEESEGASDGGAEAAEDSNEATVTEEGGVAALAETADETSTADDSGEVTGACNPDPTTLNGVPARRDNAASNTKPQSNLVLLVRFKGDTTGDYDSTAGDYTGLNALYPYKNNDISYTNWQRLMYSYNNVEESYFANSISMRQFIYQYSKGKHDVISRFPQTTSDGHVQYITLDNPATNYISAYGGYLDDSTLVKETLSKLETMLPNLNLNDMDTDNDGYIDCLTIIPQVPSGYSGWTSRSTPIGGYGFTVAGKKIAEYNFIDTATIAKYGSYNAAGVGAHEYMHTLGAKDLYVRTGETSVRPVSIWDNMASSDSNSWPTAFTRERLGWTTIDEVTEAGSYTLHAPASDERQAIKVKSPLSNDEYFVIEYRKKGTNYTGLGALDRSIGASGLIVYRVDPSKNSEGNAGGGDSWNVYVFRPGDKAESKKGGDGITSDNGYAANAVIYASSTDRNSVGTTDLTKGFSDGALVYSDGSNSGIKITATQDGTDSCTFELTFADYNADKSAWKNVSGSDGSTLQSIIDSTGGDPYANTLATDGTNIYAAVIYKNASANEYSSPSYSTAVAKFDGSTWTQLGSSITNITYSDKAEMVWHKDALYVLTVNASYSGATLRRYNTDTNSWDEVGSISLSNISHVSMASIGGTLYVAAATGSAADVYALNDSSLSKVGNGSLSGSFASLQLVNVGGAPAVVYGNTSGTWSTKVAKLDNGTWEDVASDTSFAASILDTAVAGDGYSYVLAAGSGSGRIFVFDSDGNYKGANTISGIGTIGTAATLSGGLNHLCVAVPLNNTVHSYQSELGTEKAGAFTALNDSNFSVASAYSVDSVMIGNKLYTSVVSVTSSSNSITLRAQATTESVAPGGNGEDPSESGVPTVRVDYASMTLGGEIGANMKCTIPDALLNDDGAYAQIDFADKHRDGKKIYVKNAKVENDLRVFTYEVYAKEMNDSFTLTFYTSSDAQYACASYTGNALKNGIFKYSVASYLSEAKALNDEKLTTLLDAMRDYGYLAQLFFSYNSDGLKVETDLSGITAESLKKYAQTITGTMPDGIALDTTRLSLDSRTDIILSFALTGNSDIGTYSFKVNGTEIQPQKNGSFYEIRISNINAKELDKTYEIAVSDRQETATVKRSAASYCYDVLDCYEANGQQTTLCNLVRSLYAYNQAAAAYFGSN